MFDFKQIEKDVLKFWEKEKIYEKLKKRNSKGKKFYFLQGPPYTSGKIHIGQAWNSSLKDMILRYKRMKGFDVWDRGGYDMHGLPTENEVQKKLKLKNKEDIEKYGVDKFVKECINFSNEHADYMSRDLWNIGVWLDYKNAYKPIEKEFISGEWAFFKKAWEQKRLYKGNKVMHWDSETETSLAKHELEYENVKDTSVFLKFKRRGKNEYFLIWTTTPWTIPYNLAIMVNPELDYLRIKVDEEVWIIAKALASIFVTSLLGKKYKVLEEFKGDKLEGLEYEHFFEKEMSGKYGELKKVWKNVHSIILSKEYVDTSAGTGLVHCAPGCGPEDYEVGKKYGIGAFNNLNERGEFEDKGKFKGWKAKEDDNKFIKEFEDKGVLIVKNEIEHEYPHSWRSHKPVVFRTTEQWFLKTEDLSKELIKLNENVNWVPESSGVNYERWAENLKDNGVTRQRFWGCPVPIWVNEEDSEDYFVVGSVEELEKLTKKKFDSVNLHKPWIDNVIIQKEGKRYKRIGDVVDVWIDSGTASWNCLYNDSKLIKRYFPADLVLEANEQTRLWFSLLQICSAVMFDRSSYENVYTTGMIIDYQGMKMSKSLGNIISPYQVIEKYSADILRYYICGVSAGVNINFSWEDIKVKQRNLIILSNIANYILDLEGQKPKKGKLEVEERWLLSKYNSALERVSNLLEEYRLDECIVEIENLYISLSRDYIKFVRDKASEKAEVLETVKEVYIGVLKMFSIVCPFLSENLWGKLGQKEKSVHLASWPKADKKKIDKKLEEEFERAMKIIELGLAIRDKEGIGLRWPLAEAEVSFYGKLGRDIKEIIASQLNVKNVVLKKVEGNEISVKLNTKLTKELESEGFSRELARKVQAERKNKGLKKGDMINLVVQAEDSLKEMFKEHVEFLKERTNSKSIMFDKAGKGSIEFKIKEKVIVIEIL